MHTQVVLLFERSVIVRFSRPIQQRTSISRMLVESRACGRDASGTWWYESSGFIIRKKRNQDEDPLMARYVQLEAYMSHKEHGN